MSIKIQMNNPIAIAKRICNNKATGLFMAETCARYMTPFVPMDTGMLSQNFTTEPFKVTYNSLYAKRLFNGDGFNFSHEKHPLATARWDRACSSAKGNQIAKEVTEYLKRL